MGAQPSRLAAVSHQGTKAQGPNNNQSKTNLSLFDFATSCLCGEVRAKPERTQFVMNSDSVPGVE